MKRNLHTSIITAAVALVLMATGPLRAATIDLSSAVATFNQGGFNISNTLVANGAGWATLGNASTGVYTATAPASLAGMDGTLTFSLEHAGSCCGAHELGHFRLSATGDVAPSVAGSWTVLTPTTAVSSEAGESFVVSPGVGPAGSLLLQNPSGGRPLYTVEAPVTSAAFAGGITGFRLEALEVPGNGLLGNGPGTSNTGGNFVLTHFAVDLDLGQPPSGVPVALNVLNHSFEADGSPATFNNNLASGWQDGGGGQRGLMGGLRTELIPRPDGTATHAWSNGGDIFQVLSDTIEADTLYTLTVDVGSRSDLNAPADLRLGAGGTFGVDLLAADSIINRTPARGTWETWEYTFIVDGTNPFIGQQLRIELLGNGVQPQFDNVRLTALTDNAIPEPATATLAMLGLGGLVMRRRRNAA